MKTILVLEDEKPLADAISKKISLCGCEAVTARTVDQGVDYLEELPRIDAIWLDHYLLGKENGLDFVAKVKNDDRWKKIPIFAVSNTASPDKVQSYLQLGVEKFFTKSNYKLEDILNEIKKAMEESNG